jgi:formylglycine-generating enzyme required for sulfatase activity
MRTLLLTILFLSVACSGSKKNKVEAEWVKIPAGSFMMGSNESNDEKPIHKVTLKSFFISKTEVTVGQYRACVKAGKCSSSAVSSCNFGSPNWTDQVGSKEDHPINCIDWNQARTFAKWAGGDLCSESQWAYSAKAGKNFKYAGSNNLGKVAWYKSNSGVSTHPVGKKKKNAWGLYDMSGNVWEWTLDEYKSSYSGAPANGLPVCSTPTCRQKASRRVVRGGGWLNNAVYLRVADRAGDAPDNRDRYLGARLCRTFP